MPSAAPSWLSLDHVWLPYASMATAPLPLPVVAAAGCRIELADGRSLIDGIASWWTACHGYNHPHIRAAVAAQLERLPHVMFAGLAHEPGYALAARLARLLPGDLDHVFFSESGSVAVEIALKMAVQFWSNQGKARSRFLAFRRGYHGDTLGALAVSDPGTGFHDALSAYRTAQVFADVPRTVAARADFERLLAAHRDELAAIIVEPLVQGAGGMRFHCADTLAFVRDACDRDGLLLILDEIMTGFGRTGRMFACEEAEVVPDIICLSKALTGGTLPLAATVANARVFAAFGSGRGEHAFMHGPTFMGNPLACAAANASLDLFASEPRLQQVAAIEAQMRTELEPCRALPGVVDVRVKGTIGVVQLATGEASQLRPAFVERGVWVRPFGDVVYLAPPFVISRDELAALTAAVVEVVTGWSRTHD
jgi:adenosylmethionine-8-amino-7-oxononanoate aminotransferase